MFYRDDSYSNYKYLVDVSDNFIVLSNSSHIAGEWNSPDTIDIIYQYFWPSFQVIETELTSTSSRYFDNVNSQATSNYYYCADFPYIASFSLFVTLLLTFVILNFTRIVKKPNFI